jgi:hypothetical protein
MKSRSKRIKKAPQLPTWRADRTGNVFASGVDPLSNRSMLDAADGLKQAPKPKPGRRSKLKGDTKRKYVTAADVLADLPPPEIAKKFRIDPAKKAFVAPPFSDHLFADALSLCLHSIAARKILRDPSILKRAQRTLERWCAKHRPAPEPFAEWRRILAGRPDEIAAVALSMTEEATRLRSSSPLGCLLTRAERAAVYAVLGKSVPDAYRAKALGAFLAEWEPDHGTLRPDELAAAAIEGPKVGVSSSVGRAGKPKAFARILAQAIKTFGSQDAAEDWINGPVMSLGMKRPVDLLVTTKGVNLIEDLLGRIESGTYT